MPYIRPYVRPYVSIRLAKPYTLTPYIASKLIMKYYSISIVDLSMDCIVSIIMLGSKLISLHAQVSISSFLARPIDQ